jgi:hypothetical protein
MKAKRLGSLNNDTGGQAMGKKSRFDEDSNISPIPEKDYTSISRDSDGNICVDFHVWSHSAKQHDSVNICLSPEEALLFAQMLNRNAKAEWNRRVEAIAVAGL